MKTIEINKYFENFPNSPQAQLELLEQYHQKYPASHFVTFFYLKLLQKINPKTYDTVKSKLLLSIPNRTEFHNCKLDNSITEENMDVVSEQDVIEDEKIEDEKCEDEKCEDEKIEDEKIEDEKFTDNEITEKPITNGEIEEDEFAFLAAQIQQNIVKNKYNPAKHNAEINLAEFGEIEDVEFISETLAMIYAEQGYPGIAIQMIKKLMALNPEKNTYFAALIEKVKNSVTNNNLEESNY